MAARPAAESFRVRPPRPPQYPTGRTARSATWAGALAYESLDGGDFGSEFLEASLGAVAGKGLELGGR